MRKTFIIVIDCVFYGGRDNLCKILDKNRHILDWYADLSHAVFVVTELSAQQLCDYIKKTDSISRIFICEVDNKDARAGRLPAKTWARLSSSLSSKERELLKQKVLKKLTPEERNSLLS
jgi:hypothetical protein